MELPQNVKNSIDYYKNLNIGGKQVRTPYYRNVKRTRGDLIVLMGKGSPEEIEDEVKILSQLRGFDLSSKSSEEIRAFMSDEGVGIDCSGYVSQLLHLWLKSTGRGNLYDLMKFPQFNPIQHFLKRLRPMANISADSLTNLHNTVPVEVTDARAGDLIRSKGVKRGDHVLLITEVQENTIHYTQSSEHYGKDNGIRDGIIRITHPDKGLEEQEWDDDDDNGQNWSYKGFLQNVEDNGIRRPKFFMK